MKTTNLIYCVTFLFVAGLLQAQVQPAQLAQQQPTDPAKSDVGAINVKGGTIQGVGSYEPGSEAQIMAQPSEGYEFRQWKGEGLAEPFSQQQTVPMNRNQSLTPVFERVWNVIVTAQPPEGGSVTGSGDYPLGTNVPITVTPNEGFTFQGWQGEGIAEPEALETTVSVNGNHDIVAVFEQENQNQNQDQNESPEDQESNEPQDSENDEGDQDEPQDPEEQDDSEDQEGEDEEAETPPPPPGAMTRDDAERLLDALQAEERKLPAGQVTEGQMQNTEGRDW